MAATVIVDAGFIVALLNRRDEHHRWATALAREHALPWRSCEAALSEAFHLLTASGAPALTDLLRRGAVLAPFVLADHLESVMQLMDKYADLPISLADACLVRISETLFDPIVFTTDAHFQVYRRHGRRIVPHRLPN